MVVIHQKGLLREHLLKTDVLIRGLTFVKVLTPLQVIGDFCQMILSYWLLCLLA